MKFVEDVESLIFMLDIFINNIGDFVECYIFDDIDNVFWECVMVVNVIFMMMVICVMLFLLK